MQYQYSIPRGTQAVMGIPTGKLQNLDARVSQLETGGGTLPKSPTSGAVDGSNAVFVFATKPNLIVSDGVVFRENHGWTASGTTVTLSNPPTFDLFGL